MNLARHELYRSFLKHLRRIPDPHVWSVVVPRFRSHLKEAAPETSALGPSPLRHVTEQQPDAAEKRELLRGERRRRGLMSARKDLRKLQAAVSCQPHALARLLEEAYGLRGAVRWQLVNHIKQTSPPNPPAFEWVKPVISLPDLPDALHPLRPKHVARAKPDTRLRPVPDTAVRKAGRDKWTHEWSNVQAPLALPKLDASIAAGREQPTTGWEDKGIVESFRFLAGLDPGMYAEASRPSAADEPSIRPQDLPTFSLLGPGLKRVFPKRAPSHYTQLPEYPLPSPRATRQNPRTWHTPRRLRPRLIRRTYRTLWDKLVWVKPVHSSLLSSSVEKGDASTPATRLKWEKCSFDEMKAYEAGKLDGGKFRGVTRAEPPKDKYSTISPEDLRWV